ncbi:uncharacterized protein LOC134782964 [Penaeus indicus]|uniref:uncharacterized protein LOC134782964 n=1 Tax=Penaeus indicus TaxID=29960 RepID=UPI00300C1A3F
MKISYKNKWLDLILIYNPCNKIEERELDHYIEQLDNPKLIIGDFNAHHSSWNPNIKTKMTNTTGINLFNYITQNNLMLLTPTGLITRIDPKTGKGTTIDLVIGSPELSHLEIKTLSNYGSDHLPIVIKDCTNKNESHITEKKWDFNKEGWRFFKEEIEKKDLKDMNSIKDILELIKNTGKKYFIFDNKSNKNKPSKPWWNKKCKEIIKQRNKAFNRWRKNPNDINRYEFKKLQTKARTIIETEKKNSWENFCSSLDFNTPSRKIWKFIKKLDGKNRTNTYPLIVNNLPIQDTEQKLEVLKGEFQKSTNKKTKRLLTKTEIKNLTEKTKTEGISKNLTLKELISVIKNQKTEKLMVLMKFHMNSLSIVPKIC